MVGARAVNGDGSNPYRASMNASSVGFSPRKTALEIVLMGPSSRHKSDGGVKLKENDNSSNHPCLKARDGEDCFKVVGAKGA